VASELDALRKLGCEICSRLGDPGTVRTEHGFDQPLRLLRELAERFPGRTIGFIRAGLVPEEAQLAELLRILERSKEAVAVTMLSNASADLNPFAGLTGPASGLAGTPAELVALLAPGYLHRLGHWTNHLAVLSPLAVQRMVEADPDDDLMQSLTAAGGRLVVPDHLFLHDADTDIFEARALQSWESRFPPPFGDLSARLQGWLDAGIREFPISTVWGGAATLHVTHSWGGGIAHWIRTFIDNDRDHVHFQLRAEGPQSDLGCGQRISLYAGNELRCPVASWWLQPPIRSVAEHSAAYREIIGRLCRRYNVGRVIVSSLIGHSLDALRTGLPTLQVLHDHFPLWPLLSVHPRPFLREQLPVDIEAALSAHAGLLEFTDKDGAAWTDVRNAYLQALTEQHVRIVAPGRSVLELQTRLEPSFARQDIHVIPHGCAIADARRVIEPRPRSDGRLRMVVLGRIQAGKGQKLLLEAIGQLVDHVQVYLLGSGKSGETFFGVHGVNVVVEYDQDELPAMLESIGPDFAALLSIVPETYSYTLSELMALGIPVIATRVGSFPDRIEHGVNGWLVEADAGALVEQVAELCRAPSELSKVRSALREVDMATTQDMLAAYDRLLPVATAPAAFIPVEPGPDQGQFAASIYQLALSEQSRKDSSVRITELRDELETRTAWALDVQRQLKRSTRQVLELRDLLEERTEWARDVQRQLKREREVRLEVERGLAEVRASLTQLQQHHQRVVAELDAVLGSTSWKITRPFRFAGRVARSFAAARAWNPLRWPRLLGNLYRNLSRAGLRGAVQGLQYGSESLSGPKEATRPEPEIVARPAAIPRAPASFPEYDHPEVSIVIPVYNKWPYTAACLNSLADATGSRSFEVIVVDDGSSDESETMLRGIDGLTYVRNEQNLGFVGSCNRGAGLARGAFLVMLNNDTEVTSGWLDELIETLEQEPGAGLVGARLVYPDGRLQESGGIIFHDGSGWNYGREDDPEKPAYNYLREVDYCSGACIALRTGLFRELGGFDELFAPAYYEDTDLAFRVRQAGLKVFVQPASTVIHHEGATSGTDLSAGVKRYQGINQAKFVERWREELASQPEAVADKRDRAALRAASQHRVEGRVLVVGAAGHKETEKLRGLMKCCKALGYGVTLVARDVDPVERDRRGLRKAGIELIDGPWLESLADLLRENGAGYGHVFVSGRHRDDAILDLVTRHISAGRIVFSAEHLVSETCDPLAKLLQSRG